MYGVGVLGTEKTVDCHKKGTLSRFIGMESGITVGQEGKDQGFSILYGEHTFQEWHRHC